MFLKYSIFFSLAFFSLRPISAHSTPLAPKNSAIQIPSGTFMLYSLDSDSVIMIWESASQIPLRQENRKYSIQIPGDRGGSGWSLTGLLDLDGCAWCNRSELLHLGPGPAPDIGRGREAGFIAAGCGRAAETDRDGIAFYPECKLAGQYDIPGGGLPCHLDRSGEIH